MPAATKLPNGGGDARFKPNQSSGVIDDRLFSDVEILPPSQVMGIFGDKGSGKSLLAAWMAERRSRLTGAPIVFFPETYNHLHGSAISISEMALGSDRMNGAIIIWDEAQVILNKYRSASTANRSLITFLTQVRKRGAYLYYTSNSPKQLDRALGEQTDIHGYCNKWTDRRCERFTPKGGGPKRHLRDCRDTVNINWVDTQGAQGYNAAVKDKRLRRPQRLVNIVNYYKLYNTLAQVEQHEIDSVSRDSLDVAREDISSGIEYPEFVVMMRGWIVELMEKSDPKPTRIVVAIFAKTIEEDTGVKTSARRVGRACAELGLKSHRTAKGMWYEMPDADTLHLFSRGLA